jgi:hypothetical protein
MFYLDTLPPYDEEADVELPASPSRPAGDEPAATMTTAAPTASTPSTTSSTMASGSTPSGSGGSAAHSTATIISSLSAAASSSTSTASYSSSTAARNTTSAGPVDPRPTGTLGGIIYWVYYLLMKSLICSHNSSRYVFEILKL